MKKIILFFLASASFLTAQPTNSPTASLQTVTVTTNGLLYRPTNFFQANSSSLVGAFDPAQFGTNGGGKIVGSGLIDTNTFATNNTALRTLAGTKQATNANLTAFGNLTPAKGNLAVYNGTNWVALPLSSTNGNFLAQDTSTATGLKFLPAPIGGGGEGGGPLQTNIIFYSTNNTLPGIRVYSYGVDLDTPIFEGKNTDDDVEFAIYGNGDTVMKGRLYVGDSSSYLQNDGGGFFNLVGSGLRVNDGDYINTYSATNATLDFPNTAGGSSSDLTITMSGGGLGNVDSRTTIVVTPSHEVMSSVTNGVFTAWVSSIFTITVRYVNSGSVSINPPSGDFRISATQYDIP